MKKAYLIISILSISFFANAQKLVNIGRLIQGGIDDGILLLNAYMEPVNKSIMVGFNNNTFRKIHAKKRFNIGLGSNIIKIPGHDRQFDINTLGLTNLEAVDPSNSVAQTALGNHSTIRIGTKSKTVDLTVFPPKPKALFSFNSVSGRDKKTMLLPSIQMGYNFKHEAITISAIPFVKLPESDFKLSVIGADWHQNLARFFPLKYLPIKIHIQGGYYYFYGHTDLHIEPGGVKINVNLSGDSAGPYDNQELKVTYKTGYISGFVSYEIKKLTLFGGIGYNSSQSSYKMLGKFPIYYTNPSSNLSINIEDTVDPIDSNTYFERAKAEAGIRLDLNRLFIQANYTFAEYGGIGVNVGAKF